MAERQQVHQIEYRWQPTRDMSAVASSLSPESLRSWARRIGPWVRHPGVDVPTESVRYETFGNNVSALAWRHRDRQMVERDHERDWRPLVSRVLLGPADLLTPEVAIVVSYLGLPDTIGPRPGSARVGTPLPALEAVRLARLVRDNAEALDRAAAREAGLERVVAAALGDQNSPLSVQLPERQIVRSPRDGPQALLLWGLRRTVWPLLGRDSRRGWSFSTFELPLSDMDPEALPDIVFRLDQTAPQPAPVTMRNEIWVRLRDAAARPAETVYQYLAELIVAAYRDHGGDELGQMIMASAGDLLSADQRIQAVGHALDATWSAATRAIEPLGDVREGDPADFQPDGEGGIRSTVRSATAVPAVTRTAGTASLSVLLTELSAGPGSQGFESAFQALRASNFRSGPQDRAAARKLICDNGWYVNVFGQDDMTRLEDILVMIFWHTVIPDLAEESVANELAVWTGRLAAPAMVVRALYATTEGATGTRQLMDQALWPALARRWLAENQIPLPTAKAPAAAPPSAQTAVSNFGDAGSAAYGVMATQVGAQPAVILPMPQTVLGGKVPSWLAVAIAIAAIVLLLATPH